MQNFVIRKPIILDGPDCTGKTTLAKKIINVFKPDKYQVLHATYKFKNKMPLYHGVLLRKAFEFDGLTIIDRHYISEYIYAKIYRNGTKWLEAYKFYDRLLEKLNIPVILCLPDDLEEGIKWFNQGLLERAEMYNDIKDVITEYLRYYDVKKCQRNIYKYHKDDDVEDLLCQM